MLLNDLISNSGFCSYLNTEFQSKENILLQGYTVICNNGIHYSVKIKVLFASKSPSN